MTETHLHVDGGLNPIPQTKKGNPIPGQFDYSECHEPCVTEYTYEVELDWAPCTVLEIAAHAVVQCLNEVCIDFESYNEKDTVSTVSTLNGPVNFYMTDNVPLKSISVGSYADLAPEEGKLPIVAAPGTTPPNGNIVAFTIFGNYSRDDEIDNDGGTGASGKTLTDPQDLTKTELMWHAYSQGLAIVIDVSSIDAVQGLDLAAIDLDWGEKWYFLYFDEDNKLLHKTEMGLVPGDQSGDGVAFAVVYPNPVSKIAIWGGMNQGQSEVVGYAIDNVCVTSLEEETAWGYGERFVEKGNWATYFTYQVQQLVCPCILYKSENIEVLSAPPPTNVRVGEFEDDDNVRVWKEFEGELTEPLQYDLEDERSAKSDGPSGSDMYIPTGTDVCIFYVHFDSVGESGVEQIGSLTFGADILGVIISGGSLGDFAGENLMFAADSQIGNSATIYPFTSGYDYLRGYDVNAPGNSDEVKFDGDTVDFTTWVSNAHDSFRVIVPKIPILCE